MSIAETLRPELASSLKALFERLDQDSRGSISLHDLQHHWSQGDLCSRLSQKDVLDSIEKFSVNGRLSYERLCCGIKFSLIDDVSTNPDLSIHSPRITSDNTTAAKPEPTKNARDATYSGYTQFKTPLMSSTRISSFTHSEVKPNNSKSTESRLQNTDQPAIKYDRDEALPDFSEWDLKSLTSDSLSEFSKLPEKHHSKPSDHPSSHQKSNTSNSERYEKDSRGNHVAANDSVVLTRSFIHNFGYHTPRQFSPIQVHMADYQLPSTIPKHLADSSNTSHHNGVHQNDDALPTSSEMFKYENLKFDPSSSSRNSNRDQASAGSPASSHRSDRNAEIANERFGSSSKKEASYSSRYDMKSWNDPSEPRFPVFSPEPEPESNVDSGVLKRNTEKSSSTGEKEISGKEANAGDDNAFDPYALTKSEILLIKSREADQARSEHRSSVEHRSASSNSDQRPSSVAKYEPYYELRPDSPEYQVKYTKAKNQSEQNEKAENGLPFDYKDTIYQSSDKAAPSNAKSSTSSDENKRWSVPMTWTPYSKFLDNDLAKLTAEELIARADAELSNHKESPSSPAPSRVVGENGAEMKITDLEKSLSKSRNKLTSIISPAGIDASDWSTPSSAASNHITVLPPKSILKKNQTSDHEKLNPEDQEKLDKMFDQALTAVNESYRLIRIGKKTLRNKGTVCVGESAEWHHNRYLSLLRHVLDLHRSLLQLIDEDEADLAEDVSCSQCGVCSTCQFNLQTMQLSIDRLRQRAASYAIGGAGGSHLSNGTTGQQAATDASRKPQPTLPSPTL